MRIISFIPLKYSTAGAFWERDLGLVTLGLRALGADAWFATLPGDSVEKGSPLLTPSFAQACDPNWWMLQKPDGIIINTWSSPRFDKIREAVCAVGCRVIEKLDTDGVKSPQIYPTHSLRRGLVDFDRRFFLKSRLPRNLYAILRFVGNGLFPFLIDTRMIRCMERVPIFAAETPLAAERVRRFLELYSANPMPKVLHIPHPVNTDHMNYDGEPEKFNWVAAVGRWHDAVKGWPLLEAVSRRFLAKNPGWSIVVAGSGSVELGTCLKKDFPGRFRGVGTLTHRDVCSLFQKAKIYFLTSHCETFNIAAAEAVCCGCSFVGPTQIPSAAYFAGANSGTVSHVRSNAHMLDALNTEAGEWARGRRNPLAISAFWKKEVGYREIAGQYFKELSVA